MKKTGFGKIALLCALLMIATAALVGCGGGGGGEKKSDAKKFLNIATGGTAGT